MISRSSFSRLGRSILGFGPTRLCPFCWASSGPLFKLHAAKQPTLLRGYGSSGSSNRWRERQGRDLFAKRAKVQKLKSRAAFKLLEINEKYKIFKRGQTVVDLGYAPGSWSQVAVDRTRPGGRVVGIDIIPALPPTGVSTIQGNFLSPGVQAEVRDFLSDPNRGRARSRSIFSEYGEDAATLTEEERAVLDRDVVEMDRHMRVTPLNGDSDESSEEEEGEDENGEKSVDVVLSDMCEPWEQTEGFRKRSLSNPYHRMMNTSGLKFRDHAGSMDLCAAALQFCVDTLKTGGHFVCKFYQGPEDKQFELRLKSLFHKVHRDKPESSRAESRENYFVALKKKA